MDPSNDRIQHEPPVGLLGGPRGVTTFGPRSGLGRDLGAIPGELTPGRWGFAITRVGVRRVWLASVFDERIVELHSAAVKSYHRTRHEAELHEFEAVEVDGHRLVSSGLEVDGLVARMRGRVSG